MAEWHTPQSAAADWPDAPSIDELASYLLAARHQCEAFAPLNVTVDGAIPEEWRIAHLMQAKAIWQANSGRREGSATDLDAAGQTVTVYPMDWQVKSLLRPQRGVPGIG